MREPKTKWLMALFGVATLSAGYYLALTTKDPLAALGVFFVAAILVIIGTYALFTAGSIAFLKLLRRNKRYYYKANHFTAVSGMIYRMKQNACLNWLPLTVVSLNFAITSSLTGRVTP